MQCDQCHEVVYRQVFQGGAFRGVECGCSAGFAERRDAPKDMYSDLVLEHVHDEHGRQVRVTSSRQLAEAEKRYNFASVVRNMDSVRINDAPQQKVFTVRDFYKSIHDRPRR